MEILLVIIVLIIIVRCYMLAVFGYTLPVKKEKQSDHIIVTRFKSYMKKRVEVTYPQWFVLCIGFKVFIFSIGALCT